CPIRRTSPSRRRWNASASSGRESCVACSSSAAPGGTRRSTRCCETTSVEDPEASRSVRHIRQPASLQPARFTQNLHALTQYGTSKALSLIHHLVRIRFCWLTGDGVNENAVIGVAVLDHPVGRCHKQYTRAMSDSD